jgi:nucleoside-diphosphate-sugar epimerase
MTTEGPPHRWLVTGATGLIGRHVAERLVRSGARVRALVRRPEAAVALARAGVEVVEGDILEPLSVRRVAHGVDVIVHAAAYASEWGPRRRFEQANVEGTRNVLDAAHDAGVARFVYLSTVSVYGDGAGRRDETSPMVSDGSGYSDTKIAAERLVWEHHHAGHVRAAMLRPALVYGAWDWKFVPKVAEALMGRGLPLIAGGDHRAQLVSVHDVVDLILLCATRDEAVGEAFNCTGEEVITWRQAFTEIARRIGAPPPKVSVPYRLAWGAGAALEAAYRLARADRPPLVTRFGATLVGVPFDYDTTKATRVLGFTAARRFAQSLPEALDWWRRERARAGAVAVG